MKRLEKRPWRVNNGPHLASKRNSPRISIARIYSIEMA